MTADTAGTGGTGSQSPHSDLLASLALSDSADSRAVDGSFGLFSAAGMGFRPPQPCSPPFGRGWLCDYPHGYWHALPEAAGWSLN